MDVSREFPRREEINRRIEPIAKIVATMPPANLATLMYICRHCANVARFADENKVWIENRCTGLADRHTRSPPFGGGCAKISPRRSSLIRSPARPSHPVPPTYLDDTFEPEHRLWADPVVGGGP